MPWETEPTAASANEDSHRVANNEASVREDPEIEEDSAADQNLFDDLEPEPTPAAEIEATVVTSRSEPDSAPPAPAPSTRGDTWKLGSKLSLAALAHDRGLVPGDVAKWFTEANSAAESLGTSIAALPEPAAASEGGGSRRVHDYLFQQGQRIWLDLTDRYGDDHAALFEVAVRSNVLLVLYEPGSAAADALAKSIREAAPRAGLPAELWQPLLDTLAKQPPAAPVRAAVRRMHADVEQYLSREGRQE